MKVPEPHPRLAPDLYEWIDAARSHWLQQEKFKVSLEGTAAANLAQKIFGFL
jgi:hypothetical protein